jgi:plasmid stability protein
MPALTIKNLPDELYDHLKASAKIHHRSLNNELIHCLETSLMARRASPQELLRDAQALRQKVEAMRITEKEINAAKNEGRA